MKHRKMETTRAFVKVCKMQKRLTALLIVVIIGSIVSSLIPPLLLKEIINTLTRGDAVVLRIACLYFLILALSGIFDAAKEALIIVFGQKVTRRLRHEMCRKLSFLKASYYTKNEAGKITSRFVNDVDTVESLFTNGIISMVADACKVVGILIMIFIMSKGLGILMLLVTPLLFLMTRQFQKRMLSAQLANRVAIGKVNNHVPETIENIRMIHSFAKEKYMEKRYDEYIEESYHAVEKSNFYDAIYSPIILTISAVIIAIMMVLSAMGGGIQEFFGMSVGTAVAIIAYVGKVFEPLESIGMEIENIQSAIAGIKRIDEFLKEEERVGTKEGITGERLFHAGNEAACIQFHGVTFGYEQEKPVFNELNLEVAAGETVTLAGRTGIGKSTIFKLILGMYAPDKGTVTVFKENAYEIPDKEKRALFGYVEQSFQIVPGTVADQITLYDPHITREQVEKAAKLVGLHEMILSFEKQYETVCTETIFSKGQMQLLSIARAVVMNPRIMLLDEITANLDSETEKKVLAAIENASKDRTVVSISHRIYEKMGNGRLITIE